MAHFKPFSRYQNGTVSYSRDGSKFLVLRQPLNLSPDNTDTYVTITQDLVQRPDLISYKAYSTVDLWWAIYEYNNIRDPFFDLKLGTILKIHSKERILAAASRINS